MSRLLLIKRTRKRVNQRIKLTPEDIQSNELNTNKGRKEKGNLFGLNQSVQLAYEWIHLNEKYQFKHCKNNGL